MNGDKQLLDNIDMTLNSDEPFIPINPETNEPYYLSIFEENDAVWVGQKVVPTNSGMDKSCFEVRGIKSIPNSEFGGATTNRQMPRFGCTPNPLSDEKDRIPAKLYGAENIEMDLSSVDIEALPDSKK